MKTKLLAIQTELSVPKSQTNTFGNYKYRSCEDILEAVKPLLKKHDCTLTINNAMSGIGERVYVVATATLYDAKSGDVIDVVSAASREAVSRKGMDDSQITGASSSYANKRALGGLFLIDDTADADATNKHGKEEEVKEPHWTKDHESFRDWATKQKTKAGDDITWADILIEMEVKHVEEYIGTKEQAFEIVEKLKKEK